MFKKAFVGTFGVGCAVVVAIIALVVIAGAIASNGNKSSSTTAPTTAPLSAPTTGTQPAPAAPAPAGKQWVVIKQFSGDGIKDTEQFTVGSEWRIDWDYTPPQSGGIIQIYVYDSKNSLAGVAANTQKSGSDTSFQHKAGTYYLKINATGSWKVAVQEMR